MVVFAMINLSLHNSSCQQKREMSFEFNCLRHMIINKLFYEWCTFKCKFFCVYRPCKESISKEMNSNNDLNLHLHDQMSGWLLLPLVTGGIKQNIVKYRYLIRDVVK